jgi:hypothetical protein
MTDVLTPAEFNDRLQDMENELTWWTHDFFQIVNRKAHQALKMARGMQAVDAQMAREFRLEAEVLLGLIEWAYRDTPEYRRGRRLQQMVDVLNRQAEE